MKYIFYLLIGILSFTSCSKDEDSKIPEEVQTVPITPLVPSQLIISNKTMPLFNADRQLIHKHLKSMTSDVTYTKIDGKWLIEANFNSEESAIFKTIRFDIKATQNDIDELYLDCTFKDGITDATKDRVYKFINENSTIIF
ncbi:MAG: hypothetical protein WBG43_07080 [Marinifilaceae bacterium]